MSNQNTKTELLVWGGGPGGYAAAFYAADLGMQVTLVDKEANPGGVCLYRGCIPSKALLHVAKVIDDAKHAQSFGVEFASPNIHLDKIKEFKENVVKKLTGGLGQLAKARNINFIKGTGKLLNAESLAVTTPDGSTTQVDFQNLIIATGSSPNKIPQLHIDSPFVWDSTAALDLNELPKSLLVIGAGYIGLELGSVYASLGSDVSVIEMTDHILPGADPDISKVLQKRLGKKFKNMLFNTKVINIQDQGSGLLVTYEDRDGKQNQTQFDRALISIGRTPNTANIGLEAVQITLNKHGFIQVDASRRTTTQNIFAIGDVTGNPMLAHKASHEARVAVDAIQNKNVAFQPRAIPAVVFTDPEIAWCGLTELEAKERQIDFSVSKFPWAASGRAMTLGATDGLTKLIIDNKTEAILGTAMVGPGAGDMISEAVLAMEMNASAADLSLCIHPHPTLSETIMEASELHYGHCTHIFKPKRR